MAESVTLSDYGNEDVTTAERRRQKGKASDEAMIAFYSGDHNDGITPIRQIWRQPLSNWDRRTRMVRRNLSWASQGLGGSNLRKVLKTDPLPSLDQLVAKPECT